MERARALSSLVVGAGIIRLEALQARSSATGAPFAPRG
jgi:hypothetical protein